jgi:hypothetical protein
MHHNDKFYAPDLGGRAYFIIEHLNKTQIEDDNELSIITGG